ncbi:MAG: plasmid mobilization relaxosome protein MobC [Parasporobacterium sp.]|nr:plasmid mobilization relaxosome protein MobC [Parasporobacterium sp.]
MRKINRTRDHAVTVRMTEAEYEELRQKVEDSGLTQQSFVLSAISGAVIHPSDELAVLREVSRTFSDYERQLRGLATNVNQLAHIANGQGMLPIEEQLENLSAQIRSYREESEAVWRLIRSSLKLQKPTAV